MRDRLLAPSMLVDALQLLGYCGDLVAHADDLAVAHLVELLVQRHDLDLGLEVDLVVVRGVERSRSAWRFCDIMMTGAWRAAIIDRTRLRKMNG